MITMCWLLKYSYDGANERKLLIIWAATNMHKRSAKTARADDERAMAELDVGSADDAEASKRCLKRSRHNVRGNEICH
ncbi:hypothetical protein MUK42_03051 [Musa troglodytarum]|uniref:Uncharacterized protein n=1 Tax=Musa troglodytarum TaxID=320322 RepID=A0A9E7FVS0_9LILI|nr:hypothetical protein MUK42_03051 [Musa troglodytarum]